MSHAPPDFDHIEVLRKRIVSLKKIARMFDEPDVIKTNSLHAGSAASFSDTVAAFNYMLGERLAAHRTDLCMRARGEIESEKKIVVKGHLCLISCRRYPIKSVANPPKLALVKREVETVETN